MSLINIESLRLTNPDPSRPGVFLLELNNGAENRFTTQFVAEIGQALDYVDQALDRIGSEEAARGGALITTSTGKFYSNGLAIEAAMQEGDTFYVPYLRMLARLLTFRVPTVAAINGHAFAGGCMFAMAHDFRIMRADRGWIAMNEVDIGIPLIAGMAAIVKCKVSDAGHARDCLLTGHRFTAADALAARFIDRAVPGDKVLDAAFELAVKFAPKASGLTPKVHLIKAELYREAAVLLLAGGTDPGGYFAKL
ncbi:hypothetical protein IWQ57_001853 [Coemansia nantahalensis]|uniref:Uncharacterized protein n=1 Tax=Coemansia nantahalensis TaxID=2789366 RepID=A0ACC1K2W1_9FUNG|nr:hypothetical protein IWQ57_001853 [Coemansia nantahalensis]